MATHRIRNRDPFVGGLPRIPADPMRTSQGFGTPQRTGGGYCFFACTKGELFSKFSFSFFSLPGHMYEVLKGEFL